ncbi:MAG: hypothetical protein KC931_26225, partial [Candidatus Omnitrophica bacterium]|nr:hypothetical protein [Candidatus Omnitrophota bacterium]
MIRTRGKEWFFRSYDKLSQEIPGLSASAVERAAKKLAEEDRIKIRPGRRRGNLNASTEFWIDPAIVEMAEQHPVSESGGQLSRFLYYGPEDARHHGIGPALLLA